MLEKFKQRLVKAFAQKIYKIEEFCECKESKQYMSTEGQNRCAGCNNPIRPSEQKNNNDFTETNSS